MSGSAFAVFLLIGASVLALWLDSHRPGLAPASGRRIALHLVAAFVLLQLAPKANGSPIASFAVVFGLILPALVYLVLTGIWFIRLAQSTLGSLYR